jgi:AbrB family looped-hinge helix DNA binding protein
MTEYSVRNKINENGRIVIPFRMRRALGLKPGDTVVMTLENGVLRIAPHGTRLRQIQAELKKFALPGTPASDKLVADRREEANNQMEEWLG